MYDARNDPQPIPGVYLNPGTGPVAGALLEHAERNVRTLCEEAGFPDATVQYANHEERGRFRFLVLAGVYSVEVDMPGLTLEQVRYIGPPQDVWLFPRLYVDGSSWIWCVAVNVLHAILSGRNEE